MSFSTPRLEIHPDRVAANAAEVYRLVHAHGGRVAAIAKGVRAHPAVLNALVSAGADMVGDSRMDNLRRAVSTGVTNPLMLLRTPSPSSVHEVVRTADVTLNSSLATIGLLAEAARSAGVTHDVVVMVDIGDLREGVWPDTVADVVAQAGRMRGVRVVGLGTNLACYGGVVPTVDNMSQLVRLRDEAASATGLELPVISGGNSSALPLLASGRMPSGINHFRIGETVLLGVNVLDRTPWPGTRQDAFRLVAEVVELERKPSIPIGPRAQNAFGETPQFVDRGLRRRAICNIGRQDTAVDGLLPEDPGIIVLGGSSDHLILDVEEAVEPVELGGCVGFRPSYGALLGLATSPYVQQIVRR